jgi:protein O-GlcNAc transferase
MTAVRFFDQAMALHQSGRWAEAETLYRRALAAEPHNAQALHLLGLLHHQAGRNAEALARIDEALACSPAWPEALANRGTVLEALGRAGEALDSYDRSLALAPDNADTNNNRGNALMTLKQPLEALASYERAVTLAPRHVQAWNNRANAFRALERLPEALESFDRALTLQPLPMLWNNRATVLREMKRWDEALASAERALALNPGDADAWNSRGATLLDLNRTPEALAAFERALALNPGHADAWSNRGVALRGLSRFAEALASFDRALALNSDLSNAQYFRGFVLQDLRRYRCSLAAFETLLAREPDNRYALGGLANAALCLCDWPRIESLMQRMADGIEGGGVVLPPLLALGYSDDPGLQRRVAAQGLRDAMPVLPPPLWTGEIYAHDRIRIAYLSADFHEHATAYLTAELFERHDRAQFEVIGVSYGPDDKSPMRARLARAFDTFLDVAPQGDLAVAGLLRELQTDIAIDLKGHTSGGRPAILAHRPAPVQVNYLAYPGTMGAPFYDYVIADRIVLPHGEQGFYDEKIVHLPDTYQPNDSTRPIAKQTPTRGEAGLPAQGFVFCCFNNNWKITAPVFALWMRLLAAAPGSVLWLLEDSADTKDNLKAAAAAQGMDPARLVFAPRLALPVHLARHRLADLFLDTLPYNAHTTASDALWAGLPLITRPGRTFAGRVAASLLTAAGLPELIVETAEDYEALAGALARDPARLRGLRETLARNRLSAPLFDTARYVRGLERAYVRMWEASQRGAPPEGLNIR